MNFLPHLCVLFNALVWGLAWLPMNLLQENGLSVIWTTFFSYLLLTALLLSFSPRIFFSFFSSKTLLIMSLAYGLTNICFNWAVTNGDVVRVVFMFYLMPIWSAIFAKIFLSEKLGFKKIFRIFIAFIGLAIVLEIHKHFLGSGKVDLYEYLALLGGVFFALANVFLRKAESFSSFERSFSIFFGSCLIPFFALLIMFILSFFDLFSNPIYQLNSFYSINSTFVFTTIILLAVSLGSANFCLQYGGSKISVQTTSLLMLIEIPVATISSAIFFNKLSDTNVMVGGFLIVFVAVWSSFDKEA
ncbi:MAG: hypothetical protein CBD16_05385 [Betaproteobacteria bacterium TMED156]|nr:MAG: hypothetical protein CBD16_05385 [Betaproteobacteria bacterium TMED156]|tara:strand:- start:277 stop:1179 length:903 start_codon:yes stop_codon:yes gene_type:complete